MSRNVYYDLTPAATVAFLNQLRTAIGPAVPNDFDVSHDQLTALAANATLLSDAEANAVRLRDAYHAAVLARDVAHVGATKTIAFVAATIYGSPNVTPSMIQSTGLKPRATTKSRVVPVTPTGVRATVESNSGISIRFKRAGNAPGVIFRLETRTLNGAWGWAAEGTAARFTVSGYGAEPRFFRVVATKNGVDALPSEGAGVYGAADVASTPTLRLAA